MRLTGVYRFVNLRNGLIYWGESSSGIGKKRKQHLKRLREGVHPNRQLQEDWNAYGASGFKFEIWERTEPERARERKEFHMLQHTKDHPDSPVYNERHACRSKYVHDAAFGPLPRIEDLPSLEPNITGALKSI